MNRISETVLIYLNKDNKYLMLLRNKKKNDYNKDKYIGIGGHIELNETKEEALIRETKEETNLHLLSYDYRGIVYFNMDGYKETMHIYTSNKFKGNIKECNEGSLYWIEKEKIFDLELWEGDRIFLDILLNSQDYFELELNYSNNILLNYKIIERKNQD